MLFDSNSAKDDIWESISHELHRGALDPKHPFRYVNLGTIGQDYPELRTVVLREVDQSLNFYMFTDSRSEKTKEMGLKDSVSLHFYHPKKRVQIRVQAKVKIHQEDEVLNRFWPRVQGDAQKAYNSRLDPGTKISKPEEGWEWPEEMDSEYFAVLKVIPQSIEILQLDRLNHLRIDFKRVGEDWEGQWLVP